MGGGGVQNYFKYFEDGRIADLAAVRNADLHSVQKCTAIASPV